MRREEKEIGGGDLGGARGGGVGLSGCWSSGSKPRGYTPAEGWMAMGVPSTAAAAAAAAAATILDGYTAAVHC